MPLAKVGNNNKYLEESIKKSWIFLLLQQGKQSPKRDSLYKSSSDEEPQLTVSDKELIYQKKIFLNIKEGRES